MSSEAITTSGLGKKYPLLHQARAPYGSLRDALASGARELVDRVFHPARARPATTEEFWALRGLDLRIGDGERVGILGRNGAGKSTLLKLLSRITEPTEGSFRIRGRVASMLEVGTGFHMELTGRENIFLSGAILGMRRAEILRKFDEIVAFAEVERFLDTPIKHYSSGMSLRLAFAVAAHIQPEILIVDEVLAVGDVEFQKKCLGKMEEAGRQGRTVLFVSHNMSAIEVLCTRAIVLDHGRVVGDGAVREQIERYLGGVGKREASLAAPVDLGGVRLQRLQLTPAPLESRAGLEFTVELRAVDGPLELQAVAILFFLPLGGRAAVIDLRVPKVRSISPTRSAVFSGSVESMPLVEGDYGVGVYVKASGLESWNHELLTLRVAPRPTSGELVPYPPRERGVVELSVTFISEGRAVQAG